MKSSADQPMIPARAARLLECLQRQTSLLDQLTVHQKALQTEVLRRDWDRLEELLEELHPLGEALAGIENERDQAFHDLAQAAETGRSLAAILAKLPREIRADVSEAYRALKVAVLRLQSNTASMDTYLRSSMATNREVLRELFPEWAAPGYSRTGQGNMGAETAGTALMVNHHQ
ncbi:FlgN protein [Alkalispirochaeta americana]|uniref:FlgN protein n=1 Tax=Alkalispirochaeta americana TaxID=159291 RepID=A0A1N6WGR2_9SPIO|nr:flagellar export chaperone FlgN [Alkalispirochaeta americana]SIQ89251.1 FlgN protein [Alkalispirochaeta americana]